MSPSGAVTLPLLPRQFLVLLLLLLLPAAAEFGDSAAFSNSSSIEPLSWLETTCGDFHRRLTLAAATVTGCLSEAARPFVVCQRCAGAYASWLDLQADLDGYPRCSRYLLASDSVQVLLRTRDFADSVWLASGCADCLQARGANDTGGGRYRPAVADFLSQAGQLRACFANYTTADPSPSSSSNSNGSSAALCRGCLGAYRDLNDQFQQLDAAQRHCMDALDALNVSRRLWGETFRCDPQDTSLQPVPLIVAAYIVAGLFYVGARGRGEIQQRKLLRQKRLTSSGGANGSVSGSVSLPAAPSATSLLMSTT